MKKYLENILIITFMIITLIVAFSHELWRDEAQQWLLVKELNIVEFFQQMKYEGHPFSWYVFLKIYSLLNLPYQLISIISWALAATSSIIVVKKFDCHFITKIFILTTPCFLYFCSAYSRSYSLILFLVVLLCLFYKKRKEKPLTYNVILFFLANVHILALGLVLSLLIIDYYDFFIKKDRINIKKRKYCSIIALFGIIVLILPLLGAEKNSLNFVSKLNIIKLIISPIGILFTVLTRQTPNILFEKILEFFLVIYIIMSVKNKEYKGLFVLIFSILFVCVIFAFVAYNTYMVSVLTMIFMFCYINFVNKNKFVNVSATFIFILLSINSINLIENEILYAYTDSKYVAEYINSEIDSSEKIYCDVKYKCVSVEPYVKNKFIFTYDLEEFTFSKWQDKQVDSKFDEEKINSIVENNGKYVLLSFENYKNAVKFENKGILSIKYVTTIDVLTDEKYVLVELH